ncbi:hypothetical protein [Roseateles sp.]|uniref:hypothetical protein n=1 Tax=Roseateles sp. TaxID=1971397 RepID=UPI0039ED0423
MNAVVQTFAIALASVAAAAAIGIGLADSTAQPMTRSAPLQQHAFAPVAPIASTAQAAKPQRMEDELHRDERPEVTTVAQNRPARTL